MRASSWSALERDRASSPGCGERNADLPLSPHAIGHSEPIQFLFNALKGIVADLASRAHREDGTSRSYQGASTDLAVCHTPSSCWVSIGSFVHQPCFELLPNELGNR